MKLEKLKPRRRAATQTQAGAESVSVSARVGALRITFGQPTTTLHGVGPERAQRLAELAGGERVLDLCRLFPSGFIDRSNATPLALAPDGAIITARVQVERVTVPAHPRMPCQVFCFDESGTPLVLVYFRGKRDWLQKKFKPQARLAVSGKLERRPRAAARMVHPHRVEPEASFAALQKPEPVYPCTRGLSQFHVRDAVAAALETLPEVPEWLPKAAMDEGIPPWRAAVLSLHAPETEEVEAALLPGHPARKRMALDEMLAHQVALALARRRRDKAGTINADANSALVREAKGMLAFALTKAQERSLGEILRDLASGDRMTRLLQGDVGSGKTIVATLAALAVVEKGGQVAIMAPTEVLAQQHYDRISPLLQKLSVSHDFVVGQSAGRARNELRQRLASGAAAVAIGTHALLSEGVDFAALRFVVVDEQHRFGVRQRAQLAAKGGTADVLIMSATPIPRTLLMTGFGDLDTSQLEEKPPGLKPIDTKAVSLSRISELLSRLDRKLRDGASIFWVCPRLEDESDTEGAERTTPELASAIARRETLERRWPGKTGVIHGKMKAAEKRDAIARFSDGRRQVLVATTVVEVGVDVPNAEVMVVEHAERFGLAQLHQLRGRVGRGGEPGFCILLYSEPLTGHARERLDVLRREQNGFVIAERDLELRGAGDLIGIRQSGLPDYRFVNPQAHLHLLKHARRIAGDVLRGDPNLTSAQGCAVRLLLWSFGREQALRHLDAP